MPRIIRPTPWPSPRPGPRIAWAPNPPLAGNVAGTAILSVAARVPDRATVRVAGWGLPTQPLGRQIPPGI